MTEREKEMAVRLAEYVDKLFAKYGRTAESEERKEELLSNLYAKFDDCLERGMSPDAAFARTVEHVDNVDYMLDGNKRIYINRYLTELIQTALLYCLIAWILTIPTRVAGFGTGINNALAMAVLAVGAAYLLTLFFMKGKRQNQIMAVNTDRLARWKRRAWLIWAAWLAAVLLTLTASRFGSNIWFWRPVSITGPYQFAQIALPYVYPLISLIVPLLFRKAAAAIGKYEAGV